jgi:hypothetical protein
VLSFRRRNVKRDENFQFCGESITGRDGAYSFARSNQALHRTHPTFSLQEADDVTILTSHSRSMSAPFFKDACSDVSPAPRSNQR